MISLQLIKNISCLIGPLKRKYQINQKIKKKSKVKVDLYYGYDSDATSNTIVASPLSFLVRVAL
jgi:hypothetical protein